MSIRRTNDTQKAISIFLLASIRKIECKKKRNDRIKWICSSFGDRNMDKMLQFSVRKLIFFLSKFIRFHIITKLCELSYFISVSTKRTIEIYQLLHNTLLWNEAFDFQKKRRKIWMFAIDEIGRNHMNVLWIGETYINDWFHWHMW